MKGGAAVLEKLKGASVPLSGTELAQALGVSRAAVHKRIEKLRASGERIIGTQRVGYRWTGSADSWTPSALRRGWVTDVVSFATVGSTQDEAKNRAAGGAPEGTLVVADRQTAGRGRWDRVWVSPRGGLWYSLILRPAIAPDRCPALTLVAALDWVRVLRRRGLDARVKWPNDVWVGEKKVAGILTEMSAETDRIHWVVMGVGVNVNNRPPAAVEAASVSQWIGPVSRQDLLSDWLARFARSYRRFVRSGFGPFQGDYNRWSLLQGRRIRLEGTVAMEGQVLGVDGFGRLRLKTARGVQTCVGGEVTVARRPA